MLQAQLVFLLLEECGRVARRRGDVLARFVGDKGFELCELDLVGLDLLKVTLHDVIHQGMHLAEEPRCALVAEVFKRGAQGRDAVDKAAHGVSPRREEARIAERGAQHRQLQARNFACHLWRHFGVAEDLVEEAADDIDHHVIDAAAGHRAQLLAVVMDEVGCHQRAAVGGHATAPAVGPAGLGRTAARHGLHEGQPADQRHHGGVDLA